MAITKKDVEYAAALARLKFSGPGLEGFTDQLDHIVQYVAKLNELNTDGIQPLAHVLDVKNVMREDVPDQKAPDPILFENAPSIKNDFFEVPKILE